MYIYIYVECDRDARSAHSTNIHARFNDIQNRFDYSL